MKKGILYGIVFCFLLTLSANAFAADTVQLVTGEWPPYTGEKLEHYGFFTEIVSAVFNEMGVTPEYKFLPWKRCEVSLQEGSAWATFPYYYNDERAAKYLYTEPLADSKGMFFYYGDKLKGFKWETYEDFKPYRMGGTQGYWYEEDFKKLGLQADLSSDEKSNVKKLILGRVDAWPTDELVGWSFIKEIAPDKVANFHTLEKPLSADKLHLMVSKTYPNAAELRDKFNAAFAKIKEKGIYQKILAKYNLAQ